MTKTPPKKLRDSDGQTMVEFALVLPLLAVLLFGVIQFGIGLALLRGYQRAGVWGPVSRSSFPPRTRSPSPHDYEKEESPRGG